MSDIVERIHEHLASDHIKGCDGRCYHCECGYDKESDKLHAEAAAEIERLQNTDRINLAVIRDQQVEIERLRALLQTCVTALDSKEMQGTWSYLYAHGYKYTGPIIPMDELRRALEQARKA